MSNRTRRTGEFISTLDMIKEFARKNKLKISRITPYDLQQRTFEDTGFIVDFGRKGSLNFVDGSTYDQSGTFDDVATYTFQYYDKNKRKYAKSYSASGKLEGKTLSMEVVVTRSNEKAPEGWGKTQEIANRKDNHSYWFYVPSKR